MSQQDGNKKLVWAVLKYEPGFVVVINLVFADDQFIFANCGTHFTIWDKKTFKEIAALKGHTYSIRFISTDQNCIYSASYDKTLKIWDKKTFKEVATFEPPLTNEGPIYVDDKYIYSSLTMWKRGIEIETMDAVKVWDKETFEELRTIQTANEVDFIFSDNKYFYTVCRWNFFSEQRDTNVKLWDKNTFEEVTTLGLQLKTTSPIFANDKYIYTGTDDYNAIVWDKETFEEVATLEGHSKDVSFLYVDEEYIYTGSYLERTVKKWDKKTFQEIATLENVNCLAIDEKYIYSSYIGYKLKLWDKETFEEVTTLGNEPLWLRSIIEDAQNIYTGSFHGELAAWNKNTLEKVVIQKIHLYSL